MATLSPFRLALVLFGIFQSSRATPGWMGKASNTVFAWHPAGLSPQRQQRIQRRSSSLLNTNDNYNRQRAPWYTTVRGGSSDANDNQQQQDGQSMDSNAAESSKSAPTADGAPWEEEDNANTMGPVVRVPEVWATGTKKRGLILMDVFCPYFGLYMANNAREAYGVCTISVLSNYMKHYFAKEQPQDWKF